jgi:hypothetical protein
MTMNQNERLTREFLRHLLATLAYRGGKTLRDAPAGFAEFRVASGSRTPAEILAHLSDLVEWTLHLCRGESVWHGSHVDDWGSGTARFFALLGDLDKFFSSDEPLLGEPDRLVQGPIADALTHVGQLAMLRRLAGSPVRGENYYIAAIRAGNVDPHQPAPLKEFD